MRDPNGNNLVDTANSCTAMGKRPSECSFIAWLCTYSPFMSRPRFRTALMSGSIRTGGIIGVCFCVFCADDDSLEGQVSSEQVDGVAFAVAVTTVCIGLVNNKRRPTATDFIRSTLILGILQE